MYFITISVSSSAFPLASVKTDAPRYRVIIEIMADDIVSLFKAEVGSVVDITVSKSEISSFERPI